VITPSLPSRYPLRKYAAALDGFDLTPYSVIDVFVVNDHDAAMLAREDWGELTADDPREVQLDVPAVFAKRHEP
jgi:hypothetical protein